MKKIFAAVALTGILAGCVNPYEKYYSDKSGGLETARTNGIKLFSEPPRLVQGGANPDEDVQNMLGDGYALIGVSSFNGKEFPVDLALQQASKVGATRVIAYHKYTETEHGAAPLVLPTYGSAFTHVGGFGTVSTSMIGTTTTMVPTSIRRYEQSATYWAPAPHGIIEFYPRDLNTAERAKLKTNKGVVVIAVRKGGPAFEADLIKDDVVTAINSTEVEDVKRMLPILQSFAAQTVTLTIVRDDQVLKKVVHLNSMPEKS